MVGEGTILQCGAGLSVRYLSGLSAMALALYHLRQGASVPLLIAAAFLFLCCVTDTFLGEIPNPLNLTVLLAGLAYHGLTSGAAGIASSLLGMLLGCALLLLPYLLGGMGAGDVKALAALGALLGPAGIFHTFVYGGLIGGLVALVYLAAIKGGTFFSPQGNPLTLFLRTGDWHALRPEPAAGGARFPYAVAFVFGFFAYHSWGALL